MYDGSMTGTKKANIPFKKNRYLLLTLVTTHKAPTTLGRGRAQFLTRN